MQIFINGLPAVLKVDSSFEYIAENSLFTGAEDFTMEITLPLKDCKQNEDIFGMIHRKDVSPQNLIFDCEIRDIKFSKFGAVTITEISESEIKIQFLEGRSLQNFDSAFDNVFINELDLGFCKYENPEDISPGDATDPEYNNWEFVCLPWVNGSADVDIIHNEMVRDVNSGFLVHKWGDEVRELTWMPYLLYIAKQICEAVGYKYDFEQWENNAALRCLLICNCLPDAWDIKGFARALPHWTVDEFFSKLEDFLGGEFSINHKERRISFNFIDSLKGINSVVSIDNVVDEFTAEVDVEESKCEYIEKRSFNYKEQSSEIWKFYDCPWFIQMIKNPESKGQWTKIEEFETLEDLVSRAKVYHNWDGTGGRRESVNSVLYARDVDMYFIIRYHERKGLDVDSLGRIHWEFKCFLQPINSFGGRNLQKDGEENSTKIDLEIVPVAIDYTDESHGDCVFLYPSNFAENEGSSSEFDFNEWEDRKNSPDFYPELYPEAVIKEGEPGDKPEYFDCIHVAFYDGSKRVFYDNMRMLLPRPFVESVYIDRDWSISKFNFSLRLNDRSFESRFRGVNLDVRRKYTFKFLSDEIPSPRAIYLIRGKRYLCESLTCVFTNEGKSNIIKGVFWAIEDDCL